MVAENDKYAVGTDAHIRPHGTSYVIEGTIVK